MYYETPEPWEESEPPESIDDEIVTCGDCGQVLQLCLCKGRCLFCFQWKQKCTCRGSRRPWKQEEESRPWLCLECEEPTEYCQCGVIPYKHLIEGILQIDDPKHRKIALEGLISLEYKRRGEKVNPGGSGIDFTQPGSNPIGANAPIGIGKRGSRISKGVGFRGLFKKVRPPCQ